MATGRFAFAPCERHLVQITSASDLLLGTFLEVAELYETVGHCGMSTG